jgi:hypothetical protein
METASTLDAELPRVWGEIIMAQLCFFDLRFLTPFLSPFY